MYLADSLGYLGYAAVVGLKIFGPENIDILWWFRGILVWGSAASILAIIAALIWFQRTLWSTPNNVAAKDSA